jgi:hypothetical protein
MALQRTVLVVGRTAREPTQLFPDDVDGSIALVVIALGWPLSETQQLVVDDALAVARERGIVFEAILAGSGQRRRASRRGIACLLRPPGGPADRAIASNARDQRSRRAMTWMSIASAFRINSFSNEPRSSSRTRERNDSPTTSCVTNCV